MPPRAPTPTDYHDAGGYEDDHVPPEVLIPAFVRDLRENRDDEDTVKAALENLCSLVNMRTSAQMEGVGVVDEVIQAMQRHSTHERILQLCCSILFDLWANAEDRFDFLITVIEVTEGCAMFVNAMRSFPRNSAIQKSGGWFLSLWTLSGNAAATLHTDDGFLILTNALSVCMDSHHHFRKVLSASILGLIERGDVDRIKEQIHEAEGISVLVEVIKRYGGSESSESSPTFAVKGLTLLAKDDERIKTTISEMDVFLPLCSAVIIQISDSEFQMKAINLMKSLVEGRDDLIDAFDAAGGTDVLGIIMRNSCYEECVASAAVLFLITLGKESTKMMFSAVSKGLLSLMVKVLTPRFKTSNILEKVAFLTLLAEAATRDKDTTPEEICAKLAELNNPTVSTFNVSMHSRDPFVGAITIWAAWSTVSEIAETGTSRTFEQCFEK